MGSYQGLANYLEFISETYGLEICINDFSGFLCVDPHLSLELQPFLIHKNPFCMQIKSSRKLWDRCLRMKKSILLKCERLKQPYYGMCYCGVEEYIVPILCQGVVIGAICAGEFSTRKDLSHYRICKIAKEYGMDEQTLKRKFQASMSSKNPDSEIIRKTLGIVSEYLANIYDTLVSTHKIKELHGIKNDSHESYILSHAIEYIRQNYQTKISAGDIASFCHCSESYINHIFKKNMKVNLRAYCNKIRIEHAKELLLGTNQNITEIALKVGFTEPNYFSNVFRDLCGVTPTDFKKRYA